MQHMYGMTIATQVPKFRFGWLYGKQSDLVVFVLPLFLMVVLSVCSSADLAWAAIAVFFVAEAGPILGQFHGGATWFHYFDRRNREYYGSNRRRTFLFFLMPALVILLTITGWYFARQLTFFIYMIWTVQHLVQQNVGILLLYRNSLSTDVTVPRVFEARTLQISAATFVAAFLVRFATHSPSLNSIVVPVVLAINVIIASLYIWKLVSQLKDGSTINVPTLVFWFVAMVMWIPLLIGPLTFFVAIILPLTVHWCQYIGLNWFLVKNKYQAPTTRDNLPLRRFAPLLLFVMVCSAQAIFLVTAGKSSSFAASPEVVTFLEALIIGFSMCHYFQDSVIWRFRDPFPREHILPFLLTQRS